MKPKHLLVAAVVLSASLAAAQDKMKCPMHEQHASQAAAQHCPGMQGDHAAGVDSRGDQAMGFMHTRTTHHFILKPDGGVIQVTAADPNDRESIRVIREHLRHIAAAFAEGDFEIPMFVHDQTPPGVPEMKQMGSGIRYSYQEVDRGGRVVITTAGLKARDAVHNFLRFQIEEHRTGDRQEAP